MKHPIQPLAPDHLGVIRFKPNKIVQHLLEHGTIDLNDIAMLEFSAEDQEQFAQLIGYSLSGYGDLSYVTDATWEAAEVMSQNPGIDSRDARIQALEATLAAVEEHVRNAATALFRIHPDDLHT